ncbi:DUF4194 domain-containing protein [Halopseudomonas yangmingensis]|uniref:DUF4194 domain-containing protein n=1 Tax=Halopseudomonas yangmingensis TaxID=1720063 RepID=A0A1I4P655_9GAMM|nr:DUF4194 domain-containing protein [Halopseudomonas yangmingensis]SFM23261.1 protein of unknown function [Halopseudomonas yangmingensis]
MTENKDDQAGRDLGSGSFFDMVRGSDAAEGEQVQSVASGAPEDAMTELAEEPQSATDSEADAGAEMPHEARRVLVYLMRQGAIIATQKPKLYQSLGRYQTQVRRHLAEVYLRLVLDEKAGIAFVGRYEQEDAATTETDTETSTEGDDDFVSLISKRTLSLYDTLLLLVLRRHYQERESAGEQKVTVDVEKLESYLTPFLPLTNHAKADRKKLNAAIQRLISKKLLSAIRGSDDRYEITPIIRYVVDAAFLESMLEDYLRLAHEEQIPVESRLLEKVPEAAPEKIRGNDQGDLLGGNP